MDLIGNQWKPRFLDSVMPRCAGRRIAPISDRQRPNHGSESWQLTEAAPWPWTVRALTKDHSTDVMRPKSLSLTRPRVSLEDEVVPEISLPLKLWPEPEIVLVASTELNI